MASEIVIAAAGGGKTTRIVERASNSLADHVALVTYTINNVLEIKHKFYELKPALPAHVEIWSWYRFLLHELARPYQRALLDHRIDGLQWVEGRSALYVKQANTDRYYLSNGRLAYSDKIAQLVIACNEQTGGAVIERLAQRFNTIFVDEIQDMAGYDLDLLELILRSSIDLVLVGDHRQATFSTNNSAKNRAYGGVKIVNKFREWEKANLCAIIYEQQTHRCNQSVASFADSFFPTEPKTVSTNTTVTGHDGVFLVSTQNVPAYVEKFQPQVLRLDRKTSCAEYPAMNFGEVKGMTFDRVLIFPHKKGKEWLASGQLRHVVGSAAKMYVGVTRARHSVAFVFDDESKVLGLARFS